MKILIAYGTYSGSTKEVGEVIRKSLTKFGHEVSLTDMRDLKHDDFAPYEAFILGTNTWFEKNEEGMMNSAFISFKDSQPDKTLFGQRPVAVYALGDADQYLHFCKAADHLEEMVKEFDGKLVTPALRISRYLHDPEGKENEINAWILQVAKGFTAP